MCVHEDYKITGYINMKIKKRIAKTLRFIADNLDIAKSDKPLIDKEVHISKTFTRSIKKVSNIRANVNKVNLDIEIAGLSSKDVRSNILSGYPLLDAVNDINTLNNDHIKYYVDRYTNCIVLGIVNTSSIYFSFSNVIERTLKYLYATYPLDAKSLHEACCTNFYDSRLHALIITPKGKLNVIFRESINVIGTTLIPDDIYLHSSDILAIDIIRSRELSERYIEIDTYLPPKAIVKNCSFK